MTAEVTTAEASGNTTSSASWRGRAFQFTLNQPEKQYVGITDKLRSLKTCDYILAVQEHAPSTDHVHIHIYAHFRETYKLSKEILKFNPHIEICRGSPKQNIDYLMKEGNILIEEGKRPNQGIKTVSEIAATPIEEVPATLFRIKNEIDEKINREKSFFEMLDEIEHDNLQAPEIIYICGDSGRGKTYKAYKLALEKFEKHDIGQLTIENNFISITNDKAKCFVIEEFRPSQMHAASFLQLTDKYGYNCNTKGGFKRLRPKCIIICSIIPPTELYKNEEVNKQFTRRITQNINLGYEPQQLNVCASDDDE